MKTKLIAFDVNGTLFDDTQIFWKAINGIFPKYGKERLPLKILQKEFGQPWTNIYRKFGITEITASDHTLYAIYNQLYKNNGSPAPSPELKKTLTLLKQKGVILAIVSTQQNAITIPLLKKYGLMQKFSKICGGISDKAKALQNIATAFRFSVKQMAYVGDQEGDILHAQKAGCISIAFCGGLHEHERLKRAKPDFIITSMPELANLPIV